MSSPFAPHAPPLLEPLPGDAAEGQDPKYTDAHEAARTEIGKLTALTGGAVDWKHVEDSTAEVLRNHGKDLLMAAYWTAAATRQRGLDGTRAGLALMGGLCERYAEGLHPARPRARAGAVEWLVENLATALAEHKPSTDDASAIESLETLLPLVDSALGQLLGDSAPSFGPVRDALKRLSLDVPQGSTEPASGAPLSPPAAEGADDAPASETRAPAPEPEDKPVSAGPEDASAGAQTAAGGETDLNAAARSEAERWLAPISEAAPAGSDARYDERHEALRAEAAKLDTPSGGAPDWKAVRAHADALLREVSKDLVVATHLCQALWAQGGWESVATSLWLIEGLHARFGAQLFPERPRARANALALLADKLELCVKALDANALSLAQTKALTAAADAMFDRLRETAGDATPSARGVGTALRGLELTVAERDASAGSKSAPSPAAKAPAKVAGGDRPAAASHATANAATKRAGPPAELPEAAPPPSSLGDVRRYLRTTGSKLAKVGDMANEAESGAALGYRLRRLAAWLPLSCTPEAQWREARPRKLDPQMRKRMEMLHSSGNWQALAKEAETALGLAPLWLDLQRFSADALHNLGEEYRDAAEAVTYEARGLVARHPALLDARFADDTPLASDETRQWLHAGTAGAGGGGTAGANTDRQPKGLPKDLGTRLSKSAPEALADAQAAIESERSERERFRMRLELARACRSAQLTAVAEALLTDLDRAIEDHGLAHWDPDLASEALAERLNMLESRSGSNGTDHPQVDTMRARLAHLAPASLARLVPPKGR